METAMYDTSTDHVVPVQRREREDTVESITLSPPEAGITPQRPDRRTLSATHIFSHNTTNTDHPLQYHPDIRLIPINQEDVYAEIKQSSDTFIIARKMIEKGEVVFVAESTILRIPQIVFNSLLTELYAYKNTDTGEDVSLRPTTGYEWKYRYKRPDKEIHLLPDQRKRSSRQISW